MSKWQQPEFFYRGNDLPYYRKRISEYFVEQENKHTVQKVRDLLNTLVDDFCPDYVHRDIKQIIQKISIGDCRDLKNNPNHIKYENSLNKIAQALYQINVSIVNDSNRTAYATRVVDFLNNLFILLLDDPKKIVAEYLFDPKIVLEVQHDNQKNNFKLHRFWESELLPFNFMERQQSHRTSELSRDFAQYICQDNDLEQVLGYMDCLITHIESNNLDFNNKKQPLIMELENLFYLLDQAIRSEQQVTLEKVENIFTEAGRSPNPSIVFKNSRQIIEKLKSLVNGNATKYMIAHQRDFSEEPAPEKP
jgi:hypothetical protein